MLTQGPTPDPKCKLNISSFLTLQHPSDCLICANDIMMIVLLLEIMRGCEGWGVVWVGGHMVGIIFFFCSVFLFIFFFLEHQSLLI